MTSSGRIWATEPWTLSQEVKMGKLEDALAQGGTFPKTMPDIPELTPEQQIACAARILAHRDYALDIAGHITFMRPGGDGSMWCTPYGLWWRELTASDIVVLDAEGNVIEGKWDVTPAVFIHTELHRSRPDSPVIVHNHPYFGSLLATMHVTPEISDQQACMFDGDIGLFDEYAGGVDDVEGGQYLARAIGSATAVILANHGVLITGSSIAQATYRSLNFERVCRLNHDALAAGQKPVPVPPDSRGMLKQAINTLGVNYFWGGALRHLLRTEPEVLD
jgi:ribulose-5-phosphate 4-epimerase/fuculose-1-phosphate aldolase